MKKCYCPHCKWIGDYSEVYSMAGFEFCPSCRHAFVGFMPESRPTKDAPDSLNGAANSQPSIRISDVVSPVKGG